MRPLLLAVLLALPGAAQDAPPTDYTPPADPDRAQGGAAPAGGGGGVSKSPFRPLGGATSGPKFKQQPAAPPPADEPPPADDGRQGSGVQVAGEEGEAAPVLKRPIHAKLHKRAKDWEPLTLKEGGDPGQTGTSVKLKLVKKGGRLVGAASKATAQARLYKAPKDARWLVISIFPKALEAKRTHLELRFRIFEGFVEEVVAASVTIDKNAPPSTAKRDSFELRRDAVDFVSDRPGSGDVIVTALDPRPGKASFNAGRLEKAEFPGRDVGFVSLSWSVKGLTAP